jgi:uncharacterized protein YajQ (UPF0234 family)
MATDAETVTDAIAAAATGPQSATVDGVTVTAKPIDDLIKAAKFLKQEEAKSGVGVKFMKMRPPGAAGVC